LIILVHKAPYTAYIVLVECYTKKQGARSNLKKCWVPGRPPIPIVIARAAGNGALAPLGEMLCW
jgi:hypothetical protein